MRTALKPNVNRDDAIRAVVAVGGLEIFNLAPQFLEEPMDHLDELRNIAYSLARLQSVDLKSDFELCKRICEEFALALNSPKLPSGVTVLAQIIEYLSVFMDDDKFYRNIWLNLAKNRRYFIRRRFAQLLRTDLTQHEADVILDVYRQKNDYQLLLNIILANPPISFPREIIDDIAEIEGEGYRLSRAMAHEININGKKSFKQYRKQFTVSSIYAAGFSSRFDLIPELRLIATQKRISSDERSGALWALARLGDKEGVFEIAASVLE